MSTTVTFQKTLLLSACLALVLATPSEAAPDPLENVAQTQPALILARALVAEAGYAARVDHPAILHVLRRRSGRKDPIGDALVALQYCSVFHADVKTAQSEVLRHATWAYLQNAAPAVARLAEQWAAGASISDPCRGDALHWGSPEDVERKAIAGNAVVPCGKTANVFLKAWRSN